MEFRDDKGRTFIGHGLFAALSYDEGVTWPVRKLVTPSPGVYDGKGHTKSWEATPTHAEPKGYLAAAQTPDNVIHLLSSGLHYRFNLPWLQAPNRGPNE